MFFLSFSPFILLLCFLDFAALLFRFSDVDTFFAFFEFFAKLEYATVWMT